MNATEDRTYNGWHNYETWVTALWIDNEEPTYRERCRLAERAETSWTLADTIKAWVTDILPDLGASLAADLLGAALSEVDWGEIADNWWAEAHPTLEA